MLSSPANSAIRLAIAIRGRDARGPQYSNLAAVTDDDLGHRAIDHHANPAEWIDRIEQPKVQS